MKKIKLKELVHLSMPLSLVELHYEQETNPKVPWADKKFNIKPYSFYKREKNQVYFYYDVAGLEWQMKQAGKYKNVSSAIKKIKIYFDKIKEILKDEKTLSRKEFNLFLKDTRRLWPWLNYMWWAIEEKEKNKKSVKNLMAARKYTEYFTPGIISVFRKSIRGFFPRGKKYVDVLSMKEIENGKMPNRSVLEKRLKSFAYTNYKLFGSWKDIIKAYDIEIENDAVFDNLTGQTAFPGKVKGKIRIISDRRYINKFKKGEILVASTTTPDYLPAMKISGAIISEHGGIISHAAITSRELKIPCVVGVKRATAILKDGDMVEVDADKGVVKILK